MEDIQRYYLDRPDIWGDAMFVSEDGPYVMWDDVEPLLKELDRLRGFAESVNQALNEGDGTYRP